jgi:hypothetical protein
MFCHLPKVTIGVARAKHHKLTTVSHRVPHSTPDHVDPFLWHQPRNANHKRLLGIHLQAQALLHKAFANCLAPWSFGVEGSRNEGVSAGAPEGGVYAVEDAAEFLEDLRLINEGAKISCSAARSRLIGIRGRHCCHRICVDKAALHQVEALWVVSNGALIERLIDISKQLPCTFSGVPAVTSLASFGSGAIYLKVPNSSTTVAGGMQDGHIDLFLTRATYCGRDLLLRHEVW